MKIIMNHRNYYVFIAIYSINEKTNAKSYRVLKIHKGVQAGAKPKGNSPISYSLGM
jgi:hypothetical protein